MPIPDRSTRTPAEDQIVSVPDSAGAGGPSIASLQITDADLTDAAIFQNFNFAAAIPAGALVVGFRCTLITPMVGPGIIDGQINLGDSRFGAAPGSLFTSANFDSTFSVQPIDNIVTAAPNSVVVQTFAQGASPQFTNQQQATPILQVTSAGANVDQVTAFECLFEILYFE